MRLAGYLRVSTDGQAEDGYGLDVQRGAIKRWAKANGHVIERWCSDEGVSGTIDALDRDGLSCVLGAIESGKAKGLVIARLDRLARSLTVQEAALAHVWRAGGVVYTVDTGEIAQDDPDDPMRTAMRQMIGVFSELERAMITKRMRDGRKEKASRGGYAGGRPALGFRAENRELVADDSEQAALQRIYDLRDTGMSLRQIASCLADEKLSPKKSDRWHPESIRQILARR